MSRIGAYELLGELGRGGMGRVLRARHVHTGAERALKLLEGAPDVETVERFRREGQALAKLGGSGVVAVHESGTEAGRFYLVMDLMPGGSLRGRCAAGRLPWEDAARLGVAVARTLAACHERGLVHRDVKPDNILFDDQDAPRLADFGCVRDLGASALTQSGTSLGTIAYMAPGVLNGERATPPSDVYSLGVVLYELASGALPYRGSALAVLSDALAGTRKPLPAELPAGFVRLVERALDPDPSRRPSASELALGLERVLAGKPSVSGPGSRRLLLAVPLVLLAGAAVAVALGRAGPERAAPGPPPVTQGPAPSPGVPPAHPKEDAERDVLLAKARASVEALEAAVAAIESGQRVPFNPDAAGVDLYALAKRSRPDFERTVAPLASSIWAAVGETVTPWRSMNGRMGHEAKVGLLLSAFARTGDQAPLEVRSGLYRLATWKAESFATERDIEDHLRADGRALLPRQALWGATLLVTAAELTVRRYANPATVLRDAEGDLEKVVPILEKLSEREPDGWAGHLLDRALATASVLELGEALRANRRGHLDGALGYLERALERAQGTLSNKVGSHRGGILSARFAIARDIRATTRDPDDLEGQLDAIRKLSGEVGSSVEKRLAGAEVERIEGHPDEAVRVAREVLKTTDALAAIDCANAIVLLGLLDQHASEEATAPFRRAVAGSPGGHDWWLGLTPEEVAHYAGALR